MSVGSLGGRAVLVNHRTLVLIWVFDQADEAETGGQYVRLSHLFRPTASNHRSCSVPARDQFLVYVSLSCSMCLWLTSRRSCGHVHRAILLGSPVLLKSTGRRSVLG